MTYTHVKSTVDLYSGDTKANKWYKIIEQDDIGFSYNDSSGEWMCCLYAGDDHQAYYGGEWVFK